VIDMSTVTAVLETERQKHARRAEAETEYRAAVRQVAAGAAVDPDEVTALLAELDRDAKTFAGDVKLMERRYELGRLADTESDLTEKIKQAEAEAKAAAELVVTHRTAAIRASQKAQLLRDKRQQAAQARRDLFHDCKDERRKRWERLWAAEQHAGREKTLVAKLLDDARSRLNDAEVREGKTHHAGVYLDDIAGIKYRVANCEKRLAAVNAEIARLSQERAAVEAEMSQP
jgi:hypothetical protein